MARSSGSATALAETSALAPVYLAVTVTDGGTISGNCVMGSWNKANIPSSTIITEMINDNIFRLINISIIFFSFNNV